MTPNSPNTFKYLELSVWGRARELEDFSQFGRIFLKTEFQNHISGAGGNPAPTLIVENRSYRRP
jgi:hypothetical protein